MNAENYKDWAESYRNAARREGVDTETMLCSDVVRLMSQVNQLQNMVTALRETVEKTARPAGADAGTMES